MMKLPLVSVIIPSYNHEHFVCDAIKSILNQTYSNIELIVIDDGSKDHSVDRINELKTNNHFTFIHRPNKGLACTLNEGLKLVSGDFIAFCASDDIYHPDRVRLQLEAMVENNSSASYTKSLVIDDFGGVLQADTELYNKNLKGGHIFDDLFTFKFVPPVTFMYKTDFFLTKIIEFNSELAAEDFDISLTASESNQISFIDEFLYSYRSPRAIGGGRVRNVAKLEVSESHLKSLMRYESHPLFNDALSEWNYRRFIMYSGYTKTKNYALSGMLGHKCRLFSWLYIKALIRIVFFWKKYH
jgi:alpha-1,3-rhamnosyltransferase